MDVVGVGIHLRMRVRVLATRGLLHAVDVPLARPRAPDLAVPDDVGDAEPPRDRVGVAVAIRREQPLEQIFDGGALALVRGVAAPVERTALLMIRRRRPRARTADA